MVVFIGNLPKSAVESAIREITHLGPGARVRIVKKQARGGEMVRYALVAANNRKQALHLIKELHGYRWKGHTLAVRLYQPRLAANEQRRVDWRSQAWIGVERRRQERRNITLTTSRVA